MEPVSQYLGGNQLDMRAHAAGLGRYASVEARARRPLASHASNSKVADPPPRQRRSSRAQRARPIPGTGRDVEGRTLIPNTSLLQSAKLSSWGLTGASAAVRGRSLPRHSRRNGANTARGPPRYRKALHNNRPITTMMPTKTNRSIRASSSGIAGPSAHPHGATSGD